MAEPPAGPLAARFEMMMSELLARQAAALGTSDEPGVLPRERAAVPPPSGRDRGETLPPVVARGMAAAPSTSPPRPSDLGLPAEARLLPSMPGPQEAPLARMPQPPAGSPAPSPTSTSTPTSPPAAMQDARPAAPAGLEPQIRSPLFAEVRSRMIFDLGRSEPAAPVLDRAKAEAAVEMRPGAVDDASAARAREPVAAKPAERPRTETAARLAAPDTLGPEPESSIRPDRLAAETAALRPAANDAPPRFDPSGLALELALLVNAEMQKGWPTARFIPLLEKPRPPGNAIDLDDEDGGNEDETADHDEDEDRSAGYEAVLAYIAERPASRRLEKTLLFAVGCYCALLHTLTTEIVEYFADLVDEDVERNHDRA